MADLVLQGADSLFPFPGLVPRAGKVLRLRPGQPQPGAEVGRGSAQHRVWPGCSTAGLRQLNYLMIVLTCVLCLLHELSHPALGGVVFVAALVQVERVVLQAPHRRGVAALCLSQEPAATSGLARQEGRLDLRSSCRASRTRRAMSSVTLQL